MKTYSAKIYLCIIFGSVLLAPLFVYLVSIKNTPNAMPSAAHEKNPAAEQNAAIKFDSFIVRKAFREKTDSSDNMEARLDRGKNYLLAQVKNRLNQLRSFSARVSDIKTLSDSERKSLLSDLNGEIAVFEAFKSEISNSVTKQDIENVAGKIKAEWIKSRLSVARTEKRIVEAKDSQLIAEADAVTSNIRKRIDDLKASGKDTQLHEKLLSASGKKIASAKRDIDSAKMKLDAVVSVSTEKERQKLMEEKNLLLMSAHASIKEAYKMAGDEARREFLQRFK
jgi:hypothetical protein